VNHRERYGKGKVEVFWRQNPLPQQQIFFIKSKNSKYHYSLTNNYNSLFINYGSVYLNWLRRFLRIKEKATLLSKRDSSGYLIVQNDAGREQDVDEQVDISEKKRFVDHHFFCFCFGGLDKRGQRKKEKGFSSELKTC